MHSYHEEVLKKKRMSMKRGLDYVHFQYLAHVALCGHLLIEEEEEEETKKVMKSKKKR